MMLHPKELETVFGDVTKLYSKSASDAFAQLAPQASTTSSCFRNCVLIRLEGGHTLLPAQNVSTTGEDVTCVLHTDLLGLRAGH